MSVVDDYGRFDGRAAILRASLYPLQLEKVTESDVEKWLLATEKAALVRLYQFEGKRFVEMQKFGQRIRSGSKWPTPPLTVVSNPPQIAAGCGSRANTPSPPDLSLGKEGFGGKGIDPPPDSAIPTLEEATAYATSPHCGFPPGMVQRWLDTKAAQGWHKVADWRASMRSSKDTYWQMQREQKASGAGEPKKKITIGET